MATTEIPSVVAAYARSPGPLGRALVRAFSPDFCDDMDWEWQSADGLTTPEAWAMAMAWQPLLQGHVTLRSAPTREEFAIVPTYEWVEFWLGCVPLERATDQQPPEPVAMAARASGIVWRALAACRGFGATENPVFWKRVFSELERDKHPDGTDDCPHMRGEAVTDKLRFFHGDGVVFPRFRLRLCRAGGDEAMERMVRLFCGVELYWDLESERRVDVILQRLAPIVFASRVPDAVELRLCLNKWEPTRVNALLASIACEVLEEPEAEVETTRGSVSALKRLRSPRYVVKAADPKGKGRWGSPPDQIEAYLEREHALSVPASFRSLTVNGSRPLDERLQFRQYVLRLFRVGGAVGSSVGHFELRLDGEGTALPAICSAIPHTQCVEALSIASSNTWRIMLDKRDGAWLGFALFHPDAASSTWRKLSMRMVFWNDDDGVGDLLALMARGNNLHVALGYSDPSDAVDAYYTATVRAGAEIRSERSDNEPLVWKLDAAARVDVCVSSTVVASLALAVGSTAVLTTAARAALPDEWVLTIVPGFGCAWVRWRDIEMVEAREAGEAFLTALKMDSCGYIGVPLAAFVELAGDAFEFLWVQSTDRQATADVMEMAKTKCPRLRSLAVEFRGMAESLHALPIPPQVQELHLKFDAFRTPLALSPLLEVRRLMVLRIIADLAPPDDVVADFVLPLLRRSPYLQCFQWLEPPRLDKSLEKNVSYAQRRFVTRTLLPGLETSTDRLAVGGGLAAAVALMSVVVDHSQESHSAITKLSSELVLDIARWAETKVERELIVFGYWW